MQSHVRKAVRLTAADTRDQPHRHARPGALYIRRNPIRYRVPSGVLPVPSHQGAGPPGIGTARGAGQIDPMGTQEAVLRALRGEADGTGTAPHQRASHGGYRGSLRRRLSRCLRDTGAGGSVGGSNNPAPGRGKVGHLGPIPEAARNPEPGGGESGTGRRATALWLGRINPVRPGKRFRVGKGSPAKLESASIINQ